MKLLLLLFLFYQADFCHAQPFVIANLRENTAIIGVDNPLAALVAGYPCNSVALTTNNGKIEKTGCGYYVYHPAELGLASLKVWIKNGKKLKLVGTFPYRIHSLPPPVALIGVSKGGLISVRLLKAQGGVRAVLLNSDFDAPFMVKRYTATATRDTAVLFTNKNEGAVYNDSLRNNLDLLQPGDAFLVSGIICVGPDSRDIEIAPIEFYIKK